MELVDHPILMFLAALLTLWMSTAVGAWWSSRSARKTPGDFGTILAATLTLSGLIIGFTFSMSISRYEQRKNCEANEANSIGTEYSRAELLAPADRATVKALLRLYVQQRVAFYTAENSSSLAGIYARTAELQEKLWAAVVASAPARSPAIDALIVAEMNAVLDAEGFTQASWWNRIPAAAWILMIAIAVISQVLVGYGTPPGRGNRILPMVLPLALSLSFLLIADIDSPRSGIIRVTPQNLLSVARSMGIDGN
jgi:hypothetical protein